MKATTTDANANSAISLNCFIKSHKSCTKKLTYQTPWLFC